MEELRFQHDYLVLCRWK